MRFIIVKDDTGNSVIIDTVYDLVIGTIANQEMAELLVSGMNLNIKMPIYHWQTCQSALLYAYIIKKGTKAMFEPNDNVILYVSLLIGTFIVIGTIIWYHYRLSLPFLKG